MPRYVTVLTQGDIDQEMVRAIEGQGYKLKRCSNYEGYVTNEFRRKDIIHVMP